MKRYNVTAIAPNRTLASGIASGAGSLDLDSAPAGAPAAPFQIAVWEEQGDGSYSRSEMEVMEVTAISGATLTIGERGMEGTSARSFSSGALVTIGLWTPSQLEHAIGFEEDAGQQSGTYEWDVDASPHLRIELTGDLTINATGIRNGRRVVLLLIQDSTGGRSLTLGNGFATANGEQLDISTDANAISALGGFTSGGAVIIDVGKSEAPSGDLQVQTDAATGLDAGTATLNGEVLQVPEGESAIASFEYRKTSGGVWILTPEQTLNDPATYSESLTGLDEEEHEFRARGESAGLIHVGNTLTFTPEGGLSPEIQTYVDSVNAQRASPLTTDNEERLQSFWERLGNSEGNLSGNLQSDLIDLIITRESMNVDSVNDGLRTLLLSVESINTGPVYRNDGLGFERSNEDVLIFDGALVDAQQITAIVLADERNSSGNKYFASQVGSNIFSEGAFVLGGGSVSGGYSTIVIDGTDSLQSAFLNPNEMDDTFEHNVIRAAGSYIGVNGSEVILESRKNDLSSADLTSTGGDPPSNIGGNFQLTLGNREEPSDRGLTGEIYAVLFLEGDHRSDLGALLSILQNTIMSDLIIETAPIT